MFAAFRQQLDGSRAHHIVVGPITHNAKRIRSQSVCQDIFTPPDFKFIWNPPVELGALAFCLGPSAKNRRRVADKLGYGLSRPCQSTFSSAGPVNRGPLDIGRERLVVVRSLSLVPARAMHVIERLVQQPDVSLTMKQAKRGRK